jgi:hypothetical protein
MKPDTLKVGDTVLWRGGWGHQTVLPARVEYLDRVEPGEKYGDAVPSMPWSEVPVCAVVTLDNGHWAYGSQLSPLVD